MILQRFRLVVLTALSATMLVAAPGAPSSSPAFAAGAAVPSPRAMPSAVPSTKTPAVDDGDVQTISEVGNSIVIGGNFTSVGGQPRSYVAAFDKTTGVLSSTFAPTLNAPVLSSTPGPTANTVYLGGTFTNVNGVTVQRVVLMDVSDGHLITTFKGAALSGRVNDLALSGNRLYLGGTFGKVGTVPHAGLASLNATTGKVDPFVNIQMSVHHNDTGSGAQGPVGPWDFDLSPDGSRLVVIGNFKVVNGVTHDQVVQIDLSGSSAQVLPWNTSRFASACFNWAFDSWVRGVSYSPDGSYFVVSATGGPNPGTMCDASSRWETFSNSTDAQPTWVSETGGDTVWATTITDTAVFVGGHQRWANNPNGRDSAAAGAVPRPGLMALDPVSGRPLQWNPGRNPPGIAVYALLATADGLYLGSNTDWIGDFKYLRPKIAFFPYAGGTPTASTKVGKLPGDLYLAGTSSSSNNDLRRIGYDGTSTATPQPVDNGGVAWSQTHGAFMVGDKVFYGGSDSALHVRGYDGATLGADTKLDPYHDPTWANVSNNLGGTFNGASPSLYGQMSTVTGMVYDSGKLYYTVNNSSSLRWRWFSPDSGIMDEKTTTVSSSVSFSQAGGMFIANGNLYYVTRNDGRLNKVAFSGGAVTGSSTVVSGPSIDGIDWRNKAMFLYSGPAANQLPAASIASSCTDLRCNLDGSGSTDPDGTIASYAWDFGDGQNGTGASPTHLYAAAGSYSVTLTVTDDRGGVATTTANVTASNPPLGNLSFVGGSHSAPGSTKFKQVTIPAAAHPGDTALLVFTRATSAAWTGPNGVPGWTQVDAFTNATMTSTVWRKTVQATDPGANVSMDIGSFAKGVLNVVVYSGVSASAPTATSHVGDISTGSHTTAAVQAGSGDWVVSYWSDKSTSTSSWTAPAGLTVRDTAVDNGTTRFDSLIADTAAPVSAGSSVPRTATTDVPGDRGLMWSITLTPAG